jgi:hypothetical protein
VRVGRTMVMNGLGLTSPGLVISLILCISYGPSKWIDPISYNMKPGLHELYLGFDKLFIYIY